MEWMQWNSGRSMWWMQWNSGVWWWGQCLFCKKVKLVDALDAVHCRRTITYHYSTASTVFTAYCIHCVHWFDLFAPKTMSLPPYTTIPLCTVSTTSTALTFLYQRQWAHHHIPLFHCILHPLYTVSTASTGVNWFYLFAPKTMSPPPYTTIPLHTASTASTGLTFLHQRQCPHHRISLFHCLLHPVRPLV